MEFGSLHGVPNDEHNGVGFVEISKILAIQDIIFFGTQQFDGVYQTDYRQNTDSVYKGDERQIGPCFCTYKSL